MSVHFWRRTDVPGTERLEISSRADGVTVEGTVVSLDEGGLALTHRWELDAAWSARSVVVDRRGPDGHRRLELHRDGDDWLVDGVRRPDLHGALEPDLSATPLCNTFPIRRLGDVHGAVLELDTCYVDAARMDVVRSRQRYVRRGPGRVHYVDLGTAVGFEADITHDDDGLVLEYEHLFSRVEPSPDRA